MYDFVVKDITGRMIPMQNFKGKVLLISNVASLCGLTNCSYNLFKKLSQKYYDQGLRILLFPCDQFGNQEPGTDQEIESRIKMHEGRFELFSKIKVNFGDTAPLFSYLKQACPGTLVNTIKWNFTKFLVDRQGIPFGRYAPSKSEEAEDLERDIQMLLQKQA